MKKEQIVHIGYHKTASTFLQKSLFRTFPNLFLPVPRKDIKNKIIYPTEINFDLNEARNFVNYWNELAEEKGTLPVYSDERLGGLPHEGGADTIIVAKRLKELFPNPKILIVIREQRSLINAVYNQFIIGYGSLSLTEYLSGRESSKANSFSPVFFEFDKQISLYQNLFGNDNVRMLPFEILRDSNEEFIEALLSGILSDEEIDLVSDKILSEVKNRARSFLYYEIKRFLNPLIEPALVGVGRLYYTWFFSSLFKLFSYALRNVRIGFIERRLKKRREIVIEKYVGDYFLQSNRKLSDILDMDLTQYGYK